MFDRCSGRCAPPSQGEGNYRLSEQLRQLQQQPEPEPEQLSRLPPLSHELLSLLPHEPPFPAPPSRGLLSLLPHELLFPAPLSRGLLFLLPHELLFPAPLSRGLLFLPLREPVVLRQEQPDLDQLEQQEVPDAPTVMYGQSS